MSSSKATFPNQRTARLGLVIGLVAFCIIVVMPHPNHLSSQAVHVAAVAVLMAIWWVSEAVPLAATALLPLILFPMLQVVPLDGVAAAYANPLIFLFLGGFLVARSMQRWQLHSFIAYSLTGRGSNKPRSMVAAIMVTTAFLSMWISNTAAAMVMLPIGQAITTKWRNDPAHDAHDTRYFAPALMLGIAFSATIGGMATLIGTPPNALFAAYLKTSHNLEIGFAQWMLLGLPIVLVLLPLTWLVLTRFAFQIPATVSAQGNGHKPLKPDLPKLSRPAKKAAFIIFLAASALIFRPALQALLPSLPISDAGILVTAALVLFAVPAGPNSDERLLNWDDAQGVRWDVLILVGGGLALASAIDSSGLSLWIGSGLTAFSFLPVFALVLLAMVLIVYLGELASNTAMAAVFLPIAGATAMNMGLDPLLLILPVALAASLGFMLPVATPPNAIIYGSGEVTSAQMLKAGAVLDIGAILVVYAAVAWLGPLIIHD